MNLAVMGLQWGDEGKGKAIDFLARDYDVVARYQGGHNAGHTIYRDGKKIVLHLLPSGIFSDETVNVIGHGVVINPIQLMNEIKEVRGHGVPLEKLEISSYAPLILPEHQQLDIVFEDSRFVKIGTTRRGIGPAYEDLIGRRAVVVRDLVDPDMFYKKVKALNTYYNKLITVSGGEKVEMDSYMDSYKEAGKFLEPHVTNTVYSLHQYTQEKKRILFEGAQGVLLDINFGTYPFVTSSNPTIGGLFTGTGMSHKNIHKVIGISKAYTTRVGGGPFPSEIFDEEAHFLREQGSEYGATTGRPRRVGWLDLIALKYSIMINGIDEIFFTKLDVLDEFSEIKVATAYKLGNQTSHRFEPFLDYLDKAKPVLKSFPGWKTRTTDTRSFDELPQNAKDYIKFVEDFIGVPIRFISVGQYREETIRR